MPCPSSTHLCGRPHLLVQAVAVEGVWGPGEHCRHTERRVGDASRWGRTLLLAQPLQQEPFWGSHGVVAALPCPPSSLPAASRMKLAFLFSCRTNWGEPWEQVCSRIFSTCLGAQGQVTAALSGAGRGGLHPVTSPALPARTHLQLDVAGAALQPCEEMLQQALAAPGGLVGDL